MNIRLAACGSKQLGGLRDAAPLDRDHLADRPLDPFGGSGAVPLLVAYGGEIPVWIQRNQPRPVSGLEQLLP
jgi:hypothetical protein